MHPYLAQELGQAHRRELHRSADTWRSTHPARTRVRKSARAPGWWATLRSRPRPEVIATTPVTIQVLPA